MTEPLTDELRSALAVTHHGRHTIIVRESEMIKQPDYMVRWIQAFPELVKLGLMTRDELELGVTKYSLTKSGRRALQGDDGDVPAV